MTSADIDLSSKGQRFVVRSMGKLKAIGITVTYYLAGNGNQQHLLHEAVKAKVENPKGEFVIIIEGNKNVENFKNNLKLLTIDEHYNYYENKGFPKKEIIKLIAKDRNVSKNEIYQKFINK